MLDHLGENVETAAQAVDARDAYLAAIGAIRLNPSIDIAVSLKLTQLGLDRSVEDCLANVEPILAAADDAGTLVMIDMEAHAYVDRTLEVVRRVHAGHPRVGVALQSYLRRSATDVFDLPAGIRVRLVKGSYLEPPDVVYADKHEVDQSFRAVVRDALRARPRDRRGDARSAAARGRPQRSSTPPKTAGHGSSSRCCTVCAGTCRRTSRGAGYPVRVYIPYGTEWYPYLTRRLAERPANMWFFASNLMTERTMTATEDEQTGGWRSWAAARWARRSSPG